MHASRQDFDRNDAVAGVQRLGCVFCALWRVAALGSWRRLSTGCVRFQSRTLPVTPAGAAYLAGVRAGGAVGSICCAGLARSGADVALVLILQQPSPNLRGGGAAATRSSGRLCSRREAQRSWDERAPRSAHWATRTCGGETWFVRLGLRAQFARLLAAEMHERLVAVFGTCAAANCAAETLGGGSE